MPNFNGFRVELMSDHLGSIIGTVKAYTDSQIDLSEAIVNGKPVSVKHYSVDKKFIKTLRIISTTPEEMTPVKEILNTSRDQRRDRLRNIPNTCNAYVCPNSPPKVIKTPKSQLQLNKSCKSPKLEKSLSRLNVSANCENQIHRVESDNNSTQWRNRSQSVGDGFIGEDISGCESEPVASRAGQRRQTRNGTTGNCSGENSNAKMRKNSGWNSIRVEDFIDEDFDFEANLALFDKQAFYEQADAHATGAPARFLFPTDEQVLVEGPNGIGFVPKKNSKQDGFPKSLEQDHHAILQQKHKSKPSLTSSPKQAKRYAKQQLSTNSGRTSGGGSIPNGTIWFSPTGQRVPVLSQTDHQRLLCFLATGRDEEGDDENKMDLPIGLTWQRIIEVAGRAVVDSSLTYLRQTGRSSLRSNQTRPPIRVLVLAGGPNLGGVLAVNAARHLATRGACVLLHPTALSFTENCSLKPSISQHPSIPIDSVCNEPYIFATTTPQLNDIVLGRVFRSELTLTRAYAPKPVTYGDLEDGFDEDEDEEECGGTMEVDGEELSQAGRMWISRIPGLKIVGHSSGITCRQKNLTIDLLILGQPMDQLDPKIRNWLSNHSAICLTVQLSPQLSRSADLNYPPQAVKSWLVQLGLPVITPISAAVGQSDVQLVDVGMTRSLVSMVTGDLRLLPPFTLFDAASLIHLEATQS